MIVLCIISTDNSLHLQKDLDRVFEWTQHWQMQLNIQKYVALQCTRCNSSNYAINGYFLELKPQYSYLGLTINGTMQWSPHINNIATKASKVLNFVKRNLNNCSAPTKASAYPSLVWSMPSSCVWDPRKAVHIQTLEKVQRRAAR